MYRLAVTRAERELGTSHPTTLSALLHLGILLGSNCKTAQEGARLYRRVLVLQEKAYGENALETLESAHFLGCLLARNRQLAEAEPLFQEASKLDELDADAAYMAALSASERGDFGSELRWLERALKADPKHAKSLVNRAVLYGEAGDLDNELACNRRAVEANPQSALAANALASCLGMRGLVDESLAVFARVLDGAGWGDAEELARAQKLHGVVTRMKAKQEASSG